MFSRKNDNLRIKDGKSPIDRVEESTTSSDLANSATDFKTSMKELADEADNDTKVSRKGLIILSIIIAIIVITAIIILATILIRTSKSSYKPCKSCTKNISELNKVFQLPDHASKEGYTGISDGVVLSDGTIAGGVVSSSGVTTLNNDDLRDTVMQNHYKANPFSRFKSGIDEAQIGENLVLAHKIYNGLTDGLTNDQLQDENQKLAKGTAAHVQGLYKRMGGIKTVYEPTKAQGIADVKNVVGRQNLVKYRDTRYAIPVATFDVDTQRLGYLDNFSTNYSGVSNPVANSSTDIFASMKAPPAQYDSSRMILTSKPQESGVMATPAIAPGFSSPMSNKVVENYRSYHVL